MYRTVDKHPVDPGNEVSEHQAAFRNQIDEGVDNIFLEGFEVLRDYFEWNEEVLFVGITAQPAPRALNGLANRYWVIYLKWIVGTCLLYTSPSPRD